MMQFWFEGKRIMSEDTPQQVNISSQDHEFCMLLW